MSYGFNQVSILGRLVRDPESRTTNNGMEISNFSIACDTGKEEASFFDCVAFNKQAEFVRQYLKKGKPIIVKGSLKQDRWEDKETGAKRSKVQIIANGFNFIPGLKQDDETSSQVKPQKSPQPTTNFENSPDDVPF